MYNLVFKRRELRAELKTFNGFKRPGVVLSDVEREAIKSGSPQAILWERKMLGSFLPDEILFIGEGRYTQTFNAAVLVADATGFTELSEKFHEAIGKAGASLLSDALNNFLGTMIQELLLQGADVIKFAGDAFLVIFKVVEGLSLGRAICRALDTSIVIQKSYGAMETEVGVTLRIKLVVSAGEVAFSTVGDDHFSHYVIVGRPVWETKDIGHFAQPGDILISRRVLKLITVAAEYDFRPIKENDQILRLATYGKLCIFFKFRNPPGISQNLQEKDGRCTKIECCDQVMNIPWINMSLCFGQLCKEPLKN